MSKKQSDLTQQEVKAIAEDVSKEVFQKFEDKICSIGCPSHYGSIALKQHIQWHNDKLASDINDLIEFRKRQDVENIKTSKKIRETLNMLHESVNTFGQSLKGNEEIKKNFVDLKLETKEHINLFDKRIWGIIIIFVSSCVGMIFSNLWTANDNIKVQNENQIRLEQKLDSMISAISKELKK